MDPFPQIVEWLRLIGSSIPHATLVSTKRIHEPIILMVTEVLEEDKRVTATLLRDNHRVLPSIGPFWATFGNQSIRMDVQYLRDSNQVILTLNSLETAPEVVKRLKSNPLPTSATLPQRSTPYWQNPSLHQYPQPPQVHPSIAAARQLSSIQSPAPGPVAPHAGMPNQFSPASSTSYMQTQYAPTPFLQTQYNAPMVQRSYPVPAAVPAARPFTAPVAQSGPLVPNHPSATRGAGCRSCAKSASSTMNYGWF